VLSDSYYALLVSFKLHFSHVVLVI